MSCGAGGCNCQSTGSCNQLETSELTTQWVMKLNSDNKPVEERVANVEHAINFLKITIPQLYFDNLSTEYQNLFEPKGE